MIFNGGGAVEKPVSSSSSIEDALENFLYNMYLNLMEAGHSMVDIDNQDMNFYIGMLAYKSKKEEAKTQNKMDAQGL